MIIQCDKCQSKFKIDDSKVTEKGVKVRCKKCSNIFTVYPPKEEKSTISLFEGAFEEKKEQEKERVSFDLPSFEFTLSEKGETKEIKEEPKKESKTESKEEFSWDQFNIDISEKKEEEKKETEEQISFDFEGFSEVKTQSEETKAEKEDLELSFDFSNLTDEEKKEETFEIKESSEGQESIEEFVKTGGKEEEEFSFSFEENMDKKPDEEIKQEDFNFDSFQFEEKKDEESSTLDEFNFEDLDKKEETNETFNEPSQNQDKSSDIDNLNFIFQGEVEREDESKKAEAEVASEELTFTFLEEDKKVSSPSDELISEEKENLQVEPEQAIPFEEVKPKSGILTIFVSILIVVLFSGSGIGFIWWQKTKILEQEGSFGISEVKAEFYESKTLGNVFVVRGKITNGYRVPKSFLKVRCVLYGKGNKKLAEKVAFASNTFTKDEIRELTYAEIEKGLNNKMGKSMMNVDVSPGKTIPFMVIFDKLPDGVTHIEVEAI